MNPAFELSPVAVALGLFVLMIVPLFGVIALMVVALAAVAALVALAGAVIAAPYLLGRSIHQRLRVRRDTRQHQALDAQIPRPAATGDPGWRAGHFERPAAA